ILGQYGVRLDKDRLIDVREQTPTDIRVFPREVNAIVSPFVRQGVLGITSLFPLLMQNARPVQAGAAKAPGGPEVEVLFQTAGPPESLVVAEREGSVSVSELVAQLRKAENRKKLLERIKREPVPVAVTVAESKGPPAGMPPGHPPVGKDNTTPRLVV